MYLLQPRPSSSWRENNGIQIQNLNYEEDYGEILSSELFCNCMSRVWACLTSACLVQSEQCIYAPNNVQCALSTMHMQCYAFVKFSQCNAHQAFVVSGLYKASSAFVTFAQIRGHDKGHG